MLRFEKLGQRLRIAGGMLAAARLQENARYALAVIEQDLRMANYWGLTPGCRNSGENTQRLGNITKAQIEAAMQDYLQWEVALMEQVRREGDFRAGLGAVNRLTDDILRHVGFCES